jgi:hypothetical protein
MDSTLTCLDGTQPYYRFDSKPAGNYFVKARLLSSVPGTSDYIPTYGNSSAHWNTATTITHGAAADTRDISMMYGTVLSGPGFINGHIYAGAGKGTAGVAMSGMLVYLKNVVTGVILNYTYTDAAGGYSFGGLPYGNYFVYPEEYGYYTTPSSILSVTPSATTVTASFKKHTDYGTITPDNLSWVGLSSIAQNTWSIYPNPCEGVLNISLEKPINGNAGIIITDITGRTVHTQDISNTTGSNISLQLHHLQSGLYILSIETSNGKFTSKFTIQ